MHRKGKVKIKGGKAGIHFFAIYQLKTQTLKKTKGKTGKKKDRTVHVWDTWNTWTSQTSWTASGEENNQRRQEVNWGVRRQWGSASLLNRQEIVSKGSGVNTAWPVCCSQALFLNVPLWSEALLFPRLCYRCCFSGDCFTVIGSGDGLTSGLWMLLHPCDILPNVCFTSCSLCLGSPADSGCN